MKPYQQQSPRLAVALCAGLLSLATLGAIGVGPATMSFRSQEMPVLAVSTDTASPQAVGGVAPLVAVIDVNAVRAQRYVTVVEAAKRGVRRS